MAVIYREGFESGSAGFTTSVAEFSDGSGDFFTITDGSNIGSFVEYAGAVGSHYFAAMDLDGEGAAATQTLTIEGIDIAGQSALGFSGLFAEDDSSDGAEDWDADTRVTVLASIDGGPFVPILGFAGQGATNTEPGLDTDFDGVADGPALSSTFTRFEAGIAGTGSLLDLRIVMENLDAGDEDIAFDELTITDGPGTPSALVINELLVSHAGTDDTEFVEFYGTPGTSLEGFSLIAVEGDAGTAGSIDLRIDFGPGDMIGTDGFFLVGNPAGLGTTYGVTPDLAIGNNSFENSSATYALVETASLSGTSVTSSEIVVDSVALTDGGAGDSFYFGAPVIGPDGSFMPAGARRTADGVDTDTAADWTLADFDLGDSNTPGASNGGDQGGGGPELVLISAIQGSSDVSALEGQEVLVEAVVTGLVTDKNGNVRGYFLQEEDTDADADAETSEGIFVFDPDRAVAVHTRVQIAAEVDEFNGLTELTNVSHFVTLETDVALPTDEVITIGLGPDYEAFEGMRVTLVASEGADPLTVIENFDLDRFGEVVVSEGNQYQPTQILDPQTQQAEIQALIEANATNRLIIDDSITSQNPDTYRLVDTGDGTPLEAGDPITADGPTLRLGAEIDGGITGIMDYGFGEWRLQADSPLDTVPGTNEGARPDGAPEVGGELKAASFNVLNYFTTIDDGSMTGPDGTLEPRGADTPEELERQTAKIVAALAELDADVVALQELENNGFGEGSAMDALVDALNAEMGAGTYAYVDPGVDYVGTDAITAGLIYKPSALSVAGAAVLVFDEPSADATRDLLADLGRPVPDDLQRNRPAVVATFEDADGSLLTVAANHFKSKGTSGLPSASDLLSDRTLTEEEVARILADPNLDQGDGQGSWTGVRADAAAELADWLATDPTGAGEVDNVLVMGDLNAYALEAPLDTLADDGFTDLAAAKLGLEAYSYVFDGQRGALDHALATDSLLDNVTGVAEWHINADEPDLLNYDLSFNDPAFYNDDFYAASDHDPLLVGLTLDDPTVTARLEFDTSGRRAVARYLEDGDVVTTERLRPVDRDIDVDGAGIEIEAGGGIRPLPQFLTALGDGVGVFSLLTDHLFMRDGQRVDQAEFLRFTLDGPLGDAQAVAFEFAGLEGSGELSLRFFDDGALVDEFLLGINGDRAEADLLADTTFDAVELGVTDDLQFQLAAVEFERVDSDEFLFV